MKRKLFYVLMATTLAMVTATSYRPAAKATTAKTAVYAEYCAYMVINGTYSVKVKFVYQGGYNYVVAVEDLQGNSLSPAGGTLQAVDPTTQSVLTGSIYFTQNGVGQSGSGTLYAYPCTH